MENSNIQITKDQVKATSYFQTKMSKIQQKLIINRTVMRNIQNGVNIVKNIGPEKWLKQSNFQYHAQQIVLELSNNL